MMKQGTGTRPSGSSNLVSTNVRSNRNSTNNVKPISSELLRMIAATGAEYA
jgi:hypothetical protein